MTLVAGAKVRAIEGLLPMIYQRLATTTRTSNTSTFTAETVTDTVSADLVLGRLYKVVAYQLIASSVANDSVNVRLREDNLTGTQMQAIRVEVPITSTVFLAYVEAHYTAAATGSKTFVCTGVRASGTGNISHNASSTQPNYLYVDYVPSGF